jgi:hypothetical protein
VSQKVNFKFVLKLFYNSPCYTKSKFHLLNKFAFTVLNLNLITMIYTVISNNIYNEQDSISCVERYVLIGLNRQSLLFADFLSAVSRIRGPRSLYQNPLFAVFPSRFRGEIWLKIMHQWFCFLVYIIIHCSSIRCNRKNVSTNLQRITRYTCYVKRSEQNIK